MFDITSKKLDIGDEVYSVKTGLPGLGKVIGIVLSTGIITMTTVSRWEKAFKCTLHSYDWLYIVAYEEPKHTISIQDFLEIYPGLTEDAAKILQSHSTLTNVVSCCEQDLEKFE